MVAAQVYNERAGQPLPAVHGCVTTGEDWQFLRLAEADVTLIDTEGRGVERLTEHGIVAIGSGGPYAQAAARALLENSELSAKDIVDKALAVAADLCIYTNHQRSIETL